MSKAKNSFRVTLPSGEVITRNSNHEYTVYYEVTGTYETLHYDTNNEGGPLVKFSGGISGCGFARDQKAAEQAISRLVSVFRPQDPTKYTRYGVRPPRGQKQRREMFNNTLKLSPAFYPVERV